MSAIATTNPNKIQFENDFGESPIALGHFADTPAELAISYSIAGFIGFVIGGWPVLAYTAFLGMNDMKWADRRNKEKVANWKASQTSELTRLMGDEQPIAEADWRSEAPRYRETPIEAQLVETQTQAISGAPVSRSLFNILADNPFLCYFILASQRTGKTTSAAAASYYAKQDAGTTVYYINLSDHGQGNREAFAHAKRVVTGDINGGHPGHAAALIAEAIDVIEEFHESNNAILIVDEWVSMAQKTRTDMDEFWKCLSPKAGALTSNGVGCGRAVWAIAPTFQAASMVDAAKVVKNFVPCILSVAPGQSIDWKNPINGVTSKIPYNGALIGQAQKNWTEAAITEPTEDEARYWQRNGKSRVFWFGGQWSALDPAPAMPTATVKKPTPERTRDYMMRLIKDVRQSDMPIDRKNEILSKGREIDAQGKDAIGYLEEVLGI